MGEIFRSLWKEKEELIMASYFTVDNSNDGSFQPHPCNKADVEILVQDECLQAGTEEKQSSV